MLLPWFGVACALLVVAGVAKLRSPSAARAALSAVRLAVPSAAVRALGAAEIAIGVAAAVQPSALTAGLVALLYGAFAVFAFVSMRSAARRHAGASAPRRPMPDLSTPS